MKIVKKAYKFRIYPSLEQVIFSQKTLVVLERFITLC